MPKRDYSEDDDFYGQGFRKEKVLSLWFGMTIPDDNEVDVFHDLCGIGYYDLDDAEGNRLNDELVDIECLLAPMSYSSSFAAKAVSAAKAKGITQARWVSIQFEFAYDPSKVKRKVADDPVFIGVFEYSID